MLIPNPIPACPFQSISMDFIINLPWSEGYNTIYIVVDCLMKHASFIPTTMGLDAEGFTLLFMKVRVVATTYMKYSWQMPAQISVCS